MALVTNEAHHLLTYIAIVFYETHGNRGDQWSSQVADCMREQYEESWGRVGRKLIDQIRAGDTDLATEFIENISHPLRRYENTEMIKEGATSFSGTPYPVFLKEVGTSCYKISRRQEFVDKAGPILLRISLKYLQGL